MARPSFDALSWFPAAHGGAQLFVDRGVKRSRHMDTNCELGRPNGPSQACYKIKCYFFQRKTVFCLINENLRANPRHATNALRPPPCTYMCSEFGLWVSQDMVSSYSSYADMSKWLARYMSMVCLGVLSARSIRTRH